MTEPSRILALQNITISPEAAEARALSLFNKYRRAAGLCPRSSTADPTEPTTTNQEEGLEEAVGLRIYSLKPCRRDPRTAIITYEESQSTPIIKSIIRKEGAINISKAVTEKGRMQIRATFRSIDQCVGAIMKYTKWAATEVPDPSTREEPMPQTRDENRNVPRSLEMGHKRGEAITEEDHTNERREAILPPTITGHEEWEARRVAEMRERRGKRLEHEEGLRINIMIRTIYVEATAVLYFARFGHIDYFQTLPVGHKGAHQIFIKYFRIESAERALAEADPLYGARRSNPPVVRENIELLRFHPVCRRQVNKKHYDNHEKICRWQVGAETLIHSRCGRSIRKSDWERHGRECNSFNYVGATTTSMTSPTQNLSAPNHCESEPKLSQGPEAPEETDSVLECNSDEDYHTPDLSDEEDDLDATEKNIRCILQ